MADIPNIEFTLPDNTGYQQAVCSSALIVVNNMNDIFKDMIEGNVDRIKTMTKEVIALESGNIEVATSPDIALFDELITKVFPVIVETYGVRMADVTADTRSAIDYYSDIWMAEWLATGLDPTH